MLIGAMILSTWNWVVRHTILRPEEEMLQELIVEILKEMEQQMCVKNIPTVAPLTTLMSMLEVGWVWGYCIRLCHCGLTFQIISYVVIFEITQRTTRSLHSLLIWINGYSSSTAAAFVRPKQSLRDKMGQRVNNWN
jgi:hypothetical protein